MLILPPRVAFAAIVKLLLAANADRNIECNGMKPIALARRQNKPEVVALLLVDKQPNWGSGVPRRTSAGTTSKDFCAHQAIKEAGRGLPDGESFETKAYRHRERLLRLKDDK